MPEAFQHPESKQRSGKSAVDEEAGQGRNQEDQHPGSLEMCEVCQEVGEQEVRRADCWILVMRPSLVTSMGELDVILTCDKLNRRGE